MKYDLGIATLQPGYKMDLYTEGITESSNTKQELFSVSRLKEHLMQLKDTEPEQLVSRIIQDVQTFSAGGAVDDITMMAIEYRSREGLAECVEISVRMCRGLGIRHPCGSQVLSNLGYLRYRNSIYLAIAWPATWCPRSFQCLSPCKYTHSLC